MRFFKYIDTIPEFPIINGVPGSFQNGDEIKVRRGTADAYRFEVFKVASDGSFSPSSITAVEWDKLAQISQTDITKLSGLKTQSEIDQSINDATWATITESMPAIQGGATAATATVLPTLGSSNKWFDASPGFWKYNNIVLKNPLGTEGVLEENEGKLYWNGTTQTWSISKMQALPQSKIKNWEALAYKIGDQVIFEGSIYEANTNTISIDIPVESKKWTYKVGNKLGEKVQAVDSNPEELTGIPAVNLTHFVVDRQINNQVGPIVIYGITAGNIALGSYIIDKVGNTITRSRAEIVTLVLGRNEFDFKVTDGEYFGWYANTQSSLGRVAYGGNSPGNSYGNYLIPQSSVSPPIALPALNTSRRFGISIIMQTGIDLDVALSQKVGQDDFGYTIDKDGENLFLTGTIVDGSYVNSVGGITITTGWKHIKIPLSETKHYIGWFNINSRQGTSNPIYYRFNNSSGSMVQFGTFLAGDTVFMDKPETATEVWINIKASSDTNAVYADAVVTSDVLINEIKGTKLAGANESESGSGGQTFDQSLNKSDNVEFASIKTSTLILNLPTSPTGLSAGRAWVDVANGKVIKVV